MIYRTPAYYRDFRCIAGECRDSCCKGWEIDIDEDTAEYYTSVDGEFGERLQNSIKDGCFVLTEDERCPFLNKNGLCDIYTELGGDKLCRICSDHPRYYEWFGAFKEGGAGLCCEAAAELILSRPFALCEKDIPYEEASGDYDEELLDLMLSAREEMFAVLCDEDMPLNEALCRVIDIAQEAQQYIYPPSEQPCEPCEDALGSIFACYAGLEPIDEKWLPYIRGCAERIDGAPPADSTHTPYLRRIALYLIFRYMLKSVYDGEALGYAKFAAVSVVMISSLYRCKAAEAGHCSFADCADIAKNYSKETEYCEENMEKLLELFASEPFFGTSALKALINEALGENVGKI